MITSGFDWASRLDAEKKGDFLLLMKAVVGESARLINSGGIGELRYVALADILDGLENRLRKTLATPRGIYEESVLLAYHFGAEFGSDLLVRGGHLTRVWPERRRAALSAILHSVRDVSLSHETAIGFVNSLIDLDEEQLSQVQSPLRRVQLMVARERLKPDAMTSLPIDPAVVVKNYAKVARWLKDDRDQLPQNFVAVSKLVEMTHVSAAFSQKFLKKVYDLPKRVMTAQILSNIETRKKGSEVLTVLYDSVAVLVRFIQTLPETDKMTKLDYQALRKVSANMSA
jgi:hypothetical protein